MSKLYVKDIILDRENIENFDKYPFNIEIIKKFKKIKLDTPVSFFIGENGIGKSTFIEAIAVNLGLNPEGGTQNFSFETNNTTSELYKYLKIYKYGSICQTKFFLRAESFYNFASEVERLDKIGTSITGYGNNSLHNCSHGESFLQLIENRFTENGLYILDEPEASLSPQKQMTLLCYIDDLVKNNCQFIISTHSPILISYINAKIYNLNNNFEIIKYEDTDIYKTYKMFLDNPYRMQRNLFD